MINCRLYSKIRLTTASVLFAVAAVASHADRLDLPSTDVGGRLYYYYDIKQGDTLYSIGKKLNVSVDDIKRYNPAIADGLRPDVRLYFPCEDFVRVGDTEHVVAKNESVYGIARKYGISVDQLLEANPAARDGIHPDMRLTIPGDKAATPTVSAPEVTTLATAPEATASAPAPEATNPAPAPEVTTPTPDPEVQQETVSEEEVIKHGPTPMPQVQKTPTTEDTQRYTTITIGEGETLYRIATERGISIEDLLEMNPDINIATYQAGDTIRVPVTTDETIVSERRINANRIVEDEAQSATAAAAPLNISLILPFKLDDPNPGRASEHVTDFYRGFLLAADESKDAGAPVAINVFDCGGSDDLLEGLLSDATVKNADLIVMPDNAGRMRAIANAVSEQTLLFNAFDSKSTQQDSVASVIQANIGHDLMYDKAIKGFMDMYDGYTTVFLSRNGGATDKSEFVDKLRNALNDAGRININIKFDDILDDSHLQALAPGVRYVIVPVSGRREEFNKIAPAIKSLRDESADADNIKVFGYPDWIVFRGHNLEMLHDLDAVIYSRFFADPESVEVRDLKRRFMSAYGREWIDNVPNQAMLGYDTGMYVIRLLRNNDGDLTSPALKYSGVQQDFNLDDTDVDGYVNNVLLLVNYRPGGVAVKKVL